MIGSAAHGLKRFLSRTDVQLFLVLQFIFVLFPWLDLWAADLFYSEDAGFFLADYWLVQGTYGLFAEVQVPVLLLLLWALLWPQRWSRRDFRLIRKKAGYLLLVLLLGPGLLVNVVAKDNWFGRARPHQVEEFGGDKQFTPAFVIAGQCEKNCSFTSGHASMGFYFIALAWVFGNRLWLYLGIGLGSVVGLGRMIQGGHFLSDVMFSFWLVYLVAQVTARFFPEDASEPKQFRWQWPPVLKAWWTSAAPTPVEPAATANRLDGERVEREPPLPDPDEEPQQRPE